MIKFEKKKLSQKKYIAIKEWSDLKDLKNYRGEIKKTFLIW
jgi:hypothetical protein